MNILYIKPSNSSFVKIDEEILSKHHNLKSIHIKSKNNIQYLISIGSLILQLLFKSSKYKVLFTRFADYHTAIIAFISKIQNKKFIIVLGGFDVVYIPSLKYGYKKNKIREKCVKYSLNNANFLLPNNPCFISSTNDFLENKPTKIGIKNITPNTKAQIKVIFNGFKINFWKMQDAEKENIALSVAIIDNYRTYKLKGIDKFIEAASHLTKYKFVLIGGKKSFFNNIPYTSNVEIIEFLPQDDLINYYHRSKIYCIFSLSEGMPNALCEAMMCKCIPVGTKVNFIPEIIKESGLIVEKNKINEYIDKIEKAFQLPSVNGELARKKIIENYSYERRESELNNLIAEISAKI